jgi:hypothetical protein
MERPLARDSGFSTQAENRLSRIGLDCLVWSGYCLARLLGGKYGTTVGQVRGLEDLSSQATNA